ncbi:hypothetical protein B0H19DRAFT_156577 [Mycena capillaripes]|nr:hypothetical protein B0H19DRAFT_156577 [Mycena capillaripes]
MDGMNPTQLPELLLEIATFVEDPRDLSSFAQVDRFTHAAVTPCLYTCINIFFESVESLAMAFRRNPTYAVGCRSLSFRFRRPSQESSPASRFPRTGSCAF